jgi:hypothetical protein
MNIIVSLSLILRIVTDIQNPTELGLVFACPKPHHVSIRLSFIAPPNPHQCYLPLRTLLYVLAIHSRRQPPSSGC